MVEENGQQQMAIDSVVILGIPVDNLDAAESVDRLFDMIGAFDRDGRPRLAVTVGADTLMKLRGWGKQQAYSSAFMNTLRHADLLIPVGAPVFRAAKVLGASLKARFSGAFLFKQILAKAGAANTAVFFLGGKSPVIHRAAELVKTTHTGIRIAGTGSITASNAQQPKPETPTAAKVAAQINSSGADLLIIDLNDPLMADWFEQYRHRLYVPLTLVTSSADDLLKAAPQHRQKTAKRIRGLGGKSRINLFFKRFGQRFFCEQAMFALLIFHFVADQKYHQLRFKLSHHRSMMTYAEKTVAKSGRGMAVKTITLPDPLDASITEDIRHHIRQMSRQAPKIVLDCSRVHFIDSSGLGLLLGLWRLAKAENREIFIVGIKPDVYRFFRLSRTLDFFEKHMYDTIADVLTAIRKRSQYASFYYLAVIRTRAVLLHFFGQLDASELPEIDTQALMATIGGRNAIFNLTGLHFIDSAGIHLFVKLHRHITANGGHCILCGLQDHVRWLFRVMRLDSLFIITDNIFAAELALRRRHARRNTAAAQTVPQQDRAQM
ncbi:MAG: STAS domain-containing protein [Thermodesulfobacteriota bacterium]